MSDEIKTSQGQSVGLWNGENIEDLQAELNRIRLALSTEGSRDRVVTSGIPYREQLPEDLHKFNAYPLWGCDKQQNCLCGARANRIVSVEDVRQYSMIEHH